MLADSPHAAEHGAILSVNLSAVRRNWRRLADRVAPAPCAAVVKADAYGLGIEPVVQALVREGCRTFFVAHLSEGIRVRHVARDATIYVLNGLPPGVMPLYRDHALRPVLGSAPEIAEWAESGITEGCALHVDTGMNRLGLTFDEFARLNAGAALGQLHSSLIMTHFVDAEVPGSAITAQQIALFDRACRLVPETPASLCNSAGIFLDTKARDAGFRGDLARPGYALYGGNPVPHRHNPMEAVARLEATVLQVRAVPAGHSVGYNAQWTARRDTTIATVSLGYADGWLRSQSAADAKAGGVALVHGVRCPFAGRVSMDLITLDVTDVPPGRVRRGDTAVLLGDGISVDDVGTRAGTNGYEILTNLGSRYTRRYVET